MPSSFSFLRNSRTNSSSSSVEHDLKSDQSGDDDDHHHRHEECRQKRTIPNENDMLERPSDHDDDSCSQSDVTDNNDDADEKNDLLTSTNDTRSVFLTRQATLYADDWPKKRALNENPMRKVSINGEATILDNKHHEKLFSDTNFDRPVSVFLSFPSLFKANSYTCNKHVSM